MRCLYCNKKLSLLKLAKGDSFCSPEHFDAHQLQLSKSAFERLMGAPSDETPKAPVVTQNPEPEAPPIEIQNVEPATPPYAPFAISTLPPFEPTQMLAPPAESPSESDEPAGRELSYPVHDSQPTTCLLNLHTALSLSELMPLRWTSPRTVELAAEAFPAAPVLPSTPTIFELPELALDQVEDIVPAETAPPVSLAQPEAAVPAVDVAPAPVPVEAPPAKPIVRSQSAIRLEEQRKRRAEARLPFLMAPSFRERVALRAPFDASQSSTAHPAALLPILPAGGPVGDPLGALAGLTSFADAASIRLRDFEAGRIGGEGDLAPSKSPRLPLAEPETGREGWHVSGTLVGLPSETLEASRKALRPLDFVPPVPVSARIQAAAVFDPLDPAKCLERQARVWRSVDAAAQDFISNQAQPKPTAPQQASPIALPAHEPALCAVETASLFLAPLDTHPLGEHAEAHDLSVAEIEAGLRSILPEAALAGALSTITWRNRTPHFPLPAMPADGPDFAHVAAQLPVYRSACVYGELASAKRPSLFGRPYRALSWAQAESELPESPRPSPTNAGCDTKFPAIEGLPREAELGINRAAPLNLDRPFAAAASRVFPPPDLTASRLTSFPHTAQAEANERVGVCTAVIHLTPRTAAGRDPAPARFLPRRDGPVLPAAKDWVRLRSLPR